MANPLARQVHLMRQVPKEGGTVRHTNSGFSIVDFLIIMALMLIVVGLFGPLVRKSNSKAANGPARPAVVHPVH
jgi:hypothetical protein